MKKILVPLDGSKVAEEILIHVELLARQSGAHVILMRVVPFLWPSEHVHLKEMGHKMDKEASDYLFTIETRLVEKGIEASVSVDEGNVPEVICDEAEERGVDLIAISTHGHGGIKRWALGSVTAKVIQASSIPLLVHRSTGEQMEEMQCKNILLPIDGSDFAESIFPQARHVAELFNAKVWFLSVVSLPGGFLSLDEEVPNIEDKVAESIKNYYSTLENRIQEEQTSIEYEVVIRKGEPPEVISDFANENDIDLIAMSTHGRSGISRWALGSVTDKVLHCSLKPILLVRAQEDKD
jgi:nucleotide-binding universal stress UspA family protein